MSIRGPNLIIGNSPYFYLCEQKNHAIITNKNDIVSYYSTYYCKFPSFVTKSSKRKSATIIPLSSTRSKIPVKKEPGMAALFHSFIMI